jgi:hypothetical protein
MSSKKTVSLAKRFPSADPINRSENSYDRSADRASQVHRSCIIPEIEIAMFQQRSRFPYRHFARSDGTGFPRCDKPLP